MTSEQPARLSAERELHLRGRASAIEIFAELDACRAELAAATAREARLQDVLRESLLAVDWESLSAVDYSTYAARLDFFDRARALLAEPDTTSGEEA